MGHARGAPSLRCPADPRHIAFRGSQRACFATAVDLDPAGRVVRLAVGSLLYDVSRPRDDEIRCAVCGACAWRPWTPIPFVPSEAMMLLCDFSTGFRPPEMVKMRPVLVLSVRARNRQTCIVVPSSSVPPSRPDAITVALDPLKYTFLERRSWAKCEMVTTVSNGRLFQFRDRKTGRGIDSRRTMIDPNDLETVRRGAARALGLRLTP